MNTRVASLGAGLATHPGNETAGWSSRLGFILAAAGSAVGLGNVWKFPYIAGEYGGGAFVLVYLGCVAIIGLPILMAEVLIGRRGGSNPIHVFVGLSRREGHSNRWQAIGWLGIVCAFCILSFYSVVAGWSLSYLWFAASGHFSGGAVESAQIAESMSSLFSGLLASPRELLVGHSAIMVATMVIVAKGVRGGVERAVRWMVPGIFVLLTLLVVYAASTSGQFARAATFMFRPDFSALTWEAVLVAMGHAFFTLSVGMTVMMAYGSYLKKDVSIGKASVAIAGLDTLVAMLAGLAIFPLVFANGLEAGAGPGLIFVTLPIAFSQLPWGGLVATLFFLFLAMAALSSTISILEPVVDYMTQRRGWSRRRGALAAGTAIWTLGLGSVLSFNLWAEFTAFDRNLFDLLDYLTANLMLPLGGLLTAVYAGWILSSDATRDESGIRRPQVFRIWRFLLRYVAPAGVGIVLVYNLV